MLLFKYGLCNICNVPGERKYGLFSDIGIFDIRWCDECWEKHQVIKKAHALEEIENNKRFYDLRYDKAVKTLNRNK